MLFFSSKCSFSILMACGKFENMIQGVLIENYQKCNALIFLFQISPVGLIILSVVSFRWCRFSEMFDWTTHSGYLYLPAWVREIGAMMQLLPLLLVPFVAVIQSCRYFLNGHGPLHEVSESTRCFVWKSPLLNTGQKCTISELQTMIFVIWNNFTNFLQVNFFVKLDLIFRNFELFSFLMYSPYGVALRKIFC